MPSIFSLGRTLSLGLLLAVGASSAPAFKICIDPGHGGSDPGAVGGGQQEAANVLDTSLKLRNWLNLDTADTAGGGSWTVIMTRTTNVDVSLSGRTTYANNNSAARFMSIHNNAASSTAATGIETFSYASTGTSADLRNKVQQEAVGVWPLANRGNKTAGFYVIRYTNMAAELHEMAFITNTGDRAYLGSATQRDTHAKSEMWGLQRHMGYAKYTPQAGTTVIVDNSSTSFTQGGGWWASTSVAGYYGSNYHTRGTASVSDLATWNFNLASAGTYTVDAWWTGGTNRSLTAPYRVFHSGGMTTYSTNQQINGGKWNTLGTHSFNAGANKIELSCWTTAGYYVVADAVRIRN